jgi:LAO/AO transport system kinase
MLHQGAARAWDPPIVTTTASEGDGLAELWSAIERHRAFLEDSGALEEKRRARALQEVTSLAAERFKASIQSWLAADGDLAARVRDRDIDPYVAASELLRRASDVPGDG